MKYYRKPSFLSNKYKMNAKMNTKKLMVPIFAVVLALFLFASVSAGEITDTYVVKVDGINASNHEISVVAGEKVTIEVYFKSLVDDTDVTIEAEIEGDKVKEIAESEVFDVETDYTYRKAFTIEVPYELKDDQSDDIYLNIEIDGKDHKTDLNEIKLRVQRPSYNAVIKSVTTPSSIEAGDTFPVDFVLKNMGYNDLDDLYVEVSIPELGISQGPLWVGDLVNIEDCDDDCDKEDTVGGRLYLDVPYGIGAGVYNMEFTVYNDDTESTKVRQIVIGNEFSSEVITVNTKKTVASGENAEFSILLVNPTDNVKVYKIITESANGLVSSASESVVAVPAGSSKTVTILANAKNEGSYVFNVNVLSENELIQSIAYEVAVDGKKTANTTVILTVVLAIIFLVLLVVLIVLIGRKPEKTEEFGESYY